jgi:hypothetical protein
MMTDTTPTRQRPEAGDANPEFRARTRRVPTPFGRLCAPSADYALWSVVAAVAAISAPMARFCAS